MSFDGNKMIQQILAGGSVYPGDQWYVGLVLSTGNPWGDTLDWVAPGPRTHYTAGWIPSPAYAGELADTGAYVNDTTFDVYVSAACTVKYAALYQGETNPRWMAINRLYSYPLSMAAGDFIRFPPGGLSITMYS